MDETAVFDMLIVGGGINGCGIARDAAGRGYSVLLVEQGDLAGGTSSGSTKLVHGGLRYLEHYQLRLVREALAEREVLWRIAPHIIRPLRFVLPHHAGLRPAWLLRAGLFVYDHLGGRKRLPATRSIRLRADPTGAPLKPELTRAFEYSDCWVDDARLVVLNARDAADRGAVIRTRTRCLGARREEGRWRARIRDERTGAVRDVSARLLVNAAGPWVGHVLADLAVAIEAPAIRLVKGSHIVVRRIYDHDHCYILQNADGRVVFTIPFERDFTLIGTTDRDYTGHPADVAIDDDEIAYLCAAVSGYFARPVVPADVVWTYSAVRPLYDDGAASAQAATRDYVLHVAAPAAEAALLTVYGGKITTYRKLAEAAMDKVAALIGRRCSGAWTALAALPGGDFPVDGVADVVADLMARFPFLERAEAERLVRAYGVQAQVLMAGAQSRLDLGEHFGGGLYGREVDYLVREEWAQEASDIVWRRSKLGLRMTKGDIECLQRAL